MIVFLKNKHTLQIDDFYFRCSIGKNGLTKKKLKEIKKLQLELIKLSIYIIEKIELNSPQQN